MAALLRLLLLLDDHPAVVAAAAASSAMTVLSSPTTPSMWYYQLILAANALSPASAWSATTVPAQIIRLVGTNKVAVDCEDDPMCRVVVDPAIAHLAVCGAVHALIDPSFASAIIDEDDDDDNDDRSAEASISMRQVAQALVRSAALAASPSPSIRAATASAVARLAASAWAPFLAHALVIQRAPQPLLAAALAAWPRSPAGSFWRAAEAPCLALLEALMLSPPMDQASENTEQVQLAHVLDPFGDPDLDNVPPLPMPLASCLLVDAHWVTMLLRAAAQVPNSQVWPVPVALRVRLAAALEGLALWTHPWCRPPAAVSSCTAQLAAAAEESLSFLGMHGQWPQISVDAEVRELAIHIRAHIDHPSRARCLAGMARKWTFHHWSEAVVAQTVGVILDLANDHRSPSKRCAIHLTQSMAENALPSALRIAQRGELCFEALMAMTFLREDPLLIQAALGAMTCLLPIVDAIGRRPAMPPSASMCFAERIIAATIRLALYEENLARRRAALRHLGAMITACGPWAARQADALIPLLCTYMMEPRDTECAGLAAAALADLARVSPDSVSEYAAAAVLACSQWLHRQPQGLPLLEKVCGESCSNPAGDSTRPTLNVAGQVAALVATLLKVLPGGEQLVAAAVHV
jgi:hypothetical protein